MIYYFPSCKVKQRNLESSLKIQSLLKEKGVVILGCCKQDNLFFSEEDMLITNCTSCSIIASEQNTKAIEISLYEFLLGMNDFIWPDYKKERITVQDCYRSIYKRKTMEAVRDCLKKMNFIIEELDENFEKNRFDGTFRYKRINNINKTKAPLFFNKLETDYIQEKNQDEIKTIMVDHVNKINTNRVVCYCNSCYEGLKIGGANVVHIVDLLAKYYN